MCELLNNVLPAFPAHAGMNRAPLPSSSGNSCVPRACGDEPAASCSWMMGCPAFPAHAGMNRRCADDRRRHPGVPRVCGDEPIDPEVKEMFKGRSPRMRG